ncbi:hypothetical protein K438DRAFT_1769723 [Mycena galopus ATCC 62051]|nr:hypothetical protein K438DRAFT_1769723 [Mycena galopus ATCC 62051]
MYEVGGRTICLVPTIGPTAHLIHMEPPILGRSKLGEKTRSEFSTFEHPFNNFELFVVACEQEASWLCYCGGWHFRSFCLPLRHEHSQCDSVEFSSNGGNHTHGHPTLTLTYLSPDKGGETHPAIIPFPEQYEQAVTDALELLVLKSRKKQNGQWIWADFKPAKWLVVVEPGSEIGLFAKQVLSALPAKEIFWCGPVYLVFGETKQSLTTWSGFQAKGAPSLHSIDWPVNYAEAIQATRNCFKDFDWGPLQQVNKPGKTLTFYLFQDQRAWIAFLPKVMTDDEVWQLVVPQPNSVMGVIVT